MVARDALVALIVAVGVGGAACGEDTPEPDVVVGVLRKCDVIEGTTAIGTAARQRRVDQEGCDSVNVKTYITNHRLEVTVRTGSGGSYVVTVAPNNVVAVGDVWLPNR